MNASSAFSQISADGMEIPPFFGEKFDFDDIHYNRGNIR